jgi:hypothetical protein
MAMLRVWSEDGPHYALLSGVRGMVVRSGRSKVCSYGYGQAIDAAPLRRASRRAAEALGTHLGGMHLSARLTVPIADADVVKQRLTPD